MFSYIGEQNYEAFFIADFKLLYQYKNFEFFVEANNLFNKKYFDIENVEMQGRIIKAGLKLKFY
jgi:iron complex outermembrane receptor protein